MSAGLAGRKLMDILTRVGILKASCVLKCRETESLGLKDVKHSRR